MLTPQGNQRTQHLNLQHYAPRAFGILNKGNLAMLELALLEAERETDVWLSGQVPPRPRRACTPSAHSHAGKLHHELPLSSVLGMPMLLLCACKVLSSGGQRVVVSRICENRVGSCQVCRWPAAVKHTILRRMPRKGGFEGTACAKPVVGLHLQEHPI